MKTRHACQLLRIALLALSCVRGNCAAPEQPLSVEIGGKKIIVPLIEGFARGDGINPTWDKVSATLTTGSGQALLVLLPKADVERLAKGQFSRSRRLFSIHTFRGAEAIEMSEQTFSDSRAQIRAGIDEMGPALKAEAKQSVGKKSATLSTVAGADVTVDVKDVDMLGYFDESPTSLGFTMVVQTGARTSKVSIGGKSVIATIATPVNGRIVFLSANSDYSSEADRQWVETAVKIWRDGMRRVNPKVEKPTALGTAAAGPMSGGDANGWRVQVRYGEPVISVDMSDKEMKKIALWVILGSVVLVVIWISQRKMGMQ